MPGVPSFPRPAGPCSRPPLTGADADPAVGGGAEVAEEPLVVVAGVALGAELAQLLGAHAAAAAAVQHQRDAGGAGGARPRSALALPAALLALSLLQVPGGQREGERGVRAAAGSAGPGRGRGRDRGGSAYRAEQGEQQRCGQRGQGAGGHPAALTGLRGARRRRRAAGRRGEPR